MESATTKSESPESPLPVEHLAGLPILLDVSAYTSSAVSWANRHAAEVQAHVARHGALLVRGLKIHGSEIFGKVLTTLFGGDLLEYTYRSTPRTALRGNVYTATEYPASEVIPQHNENAYSRHWPNRIGFFCMLPSATGGETPIGDSRLVFKLLPQELRDRFTRNGIMYVRNYSMLDLPWQVVFQTTERVAVERYCEENELTCEWLGEDRLRTTQVNPATAIHPLTGEELWFNQAHLFHVSNLRPEIAVTLAESLGEEALPRNACFGDGTPIDPESLATIRAAYERTKIRFSWQRNDLLLLDNMLYTHGREAFTGARKVLTGMACPNR